MSGEHTCERRGRETSVFLGPPFQIPPWWIAFSRWLIFLALACNSKVSLLADYFIPASPFARFPLNLERICKRCFFSGGGGVGAVFFSKLLLRTSFSDKESFQIIGSFEWALIYGLRQEAAYVWREKETLPGNFISDFAKLISEVFREFCKLLTLK